MVKSELIHCIHKKMKDLSFKDVELGVNTTLDYLSTVLAAGKRIEIRGFGSCSLRHRPPRQAHNPKTGEWGYTQEKYTPHFKPGKNLKERVNNNRHHCTINDNSTQEGSESTSTEAS